VKQRQSPENDKADAKEEITVSPLVMPLLDAQQRTHGQGMWYFS